MNKIDKVKELIVETVSSYNEDWGSVEDLTEFIETVNKTDDLKNQIKLLFNHYYFNNFIINMF